MGLFFTIYSRVLQALDLGFNLNALYRRALDWRTLDLVPQNKLLGPPVALNALYVYTFQESLSQQLENVDGSI